MKITKAFLLWVCFCGGLFASNFIIGKEGLLNSSTRVVIDEVGAELFAKTGVSAYVIIEDSIHHNTLSTKAQREHFIQQTLQTLPRPYFALFFIKQDQKIAFYTSENIKDRIDLEKIYRQYMVPFLPLTQKEVLDVSRISAIVLNGYVHFADALAKSHGAEVASSLIDRSGDLLAWVARFVMIVMIVLLVGIFIYMRLRRRS